MQSSRAWLDLNICLVFGVVTTDHGDPLCGWRGTVKAVVVSELGLFEIADKVRVKPDPLICSDQKKNACIFNILTFKSGGHTLSAPFARCIYGSILEGG